MAAAPSRDLAHAREPMVPAPFRVVERRRDTADTWTLELEPAGGGPAMPFAPGQFTMLAAGGAGEVPISISGDPSRPERLVHTVRAVGAATRAICASAPGRVLGVRGPFGHPWPVDQIEGADIVVVAGGIGLAPLRPAVLALLARRERYGQLAVVYGGRDPGQLLYAEELVRWRRLGVDVAVTVDTAGPSWDGSVGVVTRLIDRVSLAPSSAVALVCGPEVMMRFAVAALGRRGVGPERVMVSLERNMQCGVGLCGHCQLGPTLICRDGPVYRYADVERWLAIEEL